MSARKKGNKDSNNYKIILINDHQPQEIRIALVDGGKLEAFDFENTSYPYSKGNIYKGRISHIEPGLQAIFVDLGEKRHGYLPFKEIHPEYSNPKGHELKEEKDYCPNLVIGQELLVQIVKEQTSTKGPRLTTYLSIPGKYVVLTLGKPIKGLSKKIKEENQRRRLKNILKEIKLPEAIGVIFRTASAEASKKNILADLRYLLRLWKGIRKQACSLPSPQLLYRDRDIIHRFLREHLSSEVKEILVDTEKALKSVEQFLRMVSPRHKKRIKLFHARPIFTLFNLEKQIEEIYHPIVKLPSGGNLFIERTEALVAIDVNSGSFVQEKDLEIISFKTNLEAVVEIARQIRLRDLGGLIIIDFIEMKQKKHKIQIEKTLRELLKKDKAKTSMTRFSKLGLIEIARQKTKTLWAPKNSKICPYCQGLGTIRSLEITAEKFIQYLKNLLKNGKSTNLKIKVNPALLTYILNFKKKELLDLEKEKKFFLTPINPLEVFEKNF